jgi:dTDP-4-amino-4,6-dideoxygalactose transaminase
MNIKFNQLDRGYLKYKNEYDSAAIKVLESGLYIMGKEGDQFEKNFAKFTGSKHCIGLNSGLDALILAFRALNIGEGDEVIVPANTYIASILGITENGATPVLIEPDEYYNLDANKIEETINVKTKAILVVHLYGQAANMDKIKQISEKHHLYLIEDCAQSHGAKFNGIMTGTWGHIGCFSFYPTKNIGAFGDSGAVITNDDLVFKKIKMLRNYGSEVKYQNEIVGVNSRLDEIQAALLSVKLRHYDELKNERHLIANRYLNEINNPEIKLPLIREDSEHVWHLFIIQTKNRDNFRDYLSKNGIETGIHYPIPPHLSNAYKYLEFNQGSLPITEYLSYHITSLPLYEGMTKEEIDYVINVINNY